MKPQEVRFKSVSVLFALYPLTNWPADIRFRIPYACVALIDSIITDHVFFVGTCSTPMNTLWFACLTFAMRLHSPAPPKKRATIANETTEGPVHSFISIDSLTRWRSIPHPMHALLSLAQSLLTTSSSAHARHQWTIFGIEAWLSLPSGGGTSRVIPPPLGASITYPLSVCSSSLCAGGGSVW